MAKTLSSKSGNVASANGGSNAYTFYLEVIQNSQSVDKNTTNITINHYAKGNNGWNFEQFTSPRSYIKLYDNNTGKTVTKKETKVPKIAASKILIGTWSGDVTHKPDGTLNINVTAEFKANINDTATYYYVPKNSTLTSGTIELDALHTPPSIGDVTFVENNTTLTGAGIAADTFVPYLSNKTATVAASFFDGASASKYQIVNGGATFSSTTSSVAMNLSNGLTYSGTTASFTIKVTDSMNGVNSKSISHTVVPYALPNLVATSSSVKRNGQTTGKVLLNLKGTFYNGSVGTKANNITLSFAYWKSGSTESTTYYVIPSTAYTISGNNITISNWAMAKNGTQITDVAKDSGYQFKIQASDAFGKTSVIQLNCTSGEYLMAKYKNRVDFKKITVGGKIVCPPPVGEVIMTSTNTNPSGTYGGTWELIDKGFNPGKISNPFTYNTTNVSSATVNVHRSDHSVTFTGTFVNKVAFSDSTQVIGQFNLSSIGISQFPEAMRFVGFSDGGNSMLQMVMGAGGDVQKIDVEYNLTSVAAGNTWYFSFTSVIDDSAMLDAACTRFYWKRTA
jgi:hypothetical protein